MQRLEVSVAVRPLYGSLGVKGLINGAKIVLISRRRIALPNSAYGRFMRICYQYDCDTPTSKGL